MGPVRKPNPEQKKTMSYFSPNTHPILATSPYRLLKPHEKAVKLVNDGVLSQRLAAQATGISRGAVQKALQAHTDGRPLGVNGRPSSLNPTGVSLLYDGLEERLTRRQEITFKTVQSEVIVFSLVF